MNFEQPPIEEESQEQLAKDYLSAYEEYKKIADRRSSDLRVLDKLRDEVAPQRMIDEQQALFDSSREEEEAALDRYIKIGDKLTPETKDKYLR